MGMVILIFLNKFRVGLESLKSAANGQQYLLCRLSHPVPTVYFYSTEVYLLFGSHMYVCGVTDK